MSWITGLVIYGGGVLCIALAVRTIVTAWHAAPPPAASETRAQRWSRVHIEGDRRAPFNELSRSDAWSGANFKMRRRA